MGDSLLLTSGFSVRQGDGDGEGEGEGEGQGQAEGDDEGEDESEGEGEERLNVLDFITEDGLKVWLTP